MDVFIAVVFKRAICGFTESGVFCFFLPPQTLWSRGFTIRAKFAADVVYERSMDVFMAEITLVYQRKKRFHLIDVCVVTGLTWCGN